MERITEEKANEIVLATFGEKIADVCTDGRETYGGEIRFYYDCGDVIIEDEVAQTVWEYERYSGWLCHRGFNSSIKVGYYNCYLDENELDELEFWSSEQNRYEDPEGYERFCEQHKLG